MIKLHASYGLKVPADQEYSSQSFHATAEVELADAAGSSPEGMKQALHGLWRELKSAVNAELNGSADSTVAIETTGGQRYQLQGPQPSSGRGHQPSGQPASRKQVGFLMSLARRNRNWSADQLRNWLRTEHNTELDSLSKQQATQLIDTLKQ